MKHATRSLCNNAMAWCAAALPIVALLLALPLARAAAAPAASPAQTPAPQFGGQCAEGLAQGQHAASNVESTEQAMQSFDSNDAETLVKGLIEEKTKANGGVFPYEDPLSGEQLKLSFDGIDFTRTIDGYG